MRVPRLHLVLFAAIPLLMAGDGDGCWWGGDDEGEEDDDGDDGGGGSDDPCGDFCAGIQAACPEDTACLGSCDHSATPPGESDIACAEAAEDCEDANACWGFYSG